MWHSIPNESRQMIRLIAKRMLISKERPNVYYKLMRIHKMPNNWMYAFELFAVDDYHLIAKQAQQNNAKPQNKIWRTPSTICKQIIAKTISRWCHVTVIVHFHSVGSYPAFITEPKNCLVETSFYKTETITTIQALLSLMLTKIISHDTHKIPQTEHARRNG